MLQFSWKILLKLAVYVLEHYNYYISNTILFQESSWWSIMIPIILQALRNRELVYLITSLIIFIWNIFIYLLPFLFLIFFYFLRFIKFLLFYFYIYLKKIVPFIKKFCLKCKKANTKALMELKMEEITEQVDAKATSN